MYTPILEKKLNGGVQKLFKFENGYGASVVSNEFSYGGDKGLWELAVVLVYENEGRLSWKLTYDTPITEDVLGWLTWEEVEETLKQIEEL